MKKLVLVFGLFVAVVALGQEENDPTRPQMKSLTQSGKLVTVKLVPEAKTLSIFLTGKEAAKLDLETADLEVSLLEKRSTKKLTVVRKDDHYLVTDELDPQKPKQIEVKTKVNGKTEKFKFKVESGPLN